jgi:hypothetical protein
MTARRALADILRESREWRSFFKQCCESDAARLRGQAWQFRNAIADRGYDLERYDVEDALLELAVELLPDSQAGREDPKSLLFREAVQWLHERTDSDTVLAAFGAPVAVDEAWELDLSGFRVFLRDRVRAVLGIEDRVTA